MKKIYRYILIALAITGVTSCVVTDNEYIPRMKNRARLVCEHTLNVVEDHTEFVNIAMLFNEYIKTPDEYKLLVMDSHLRGWTIAQVENGFTLDNGQKKYYIFHGDRAIDEAGSEWRINRLQLGIYLEAEQSVSYEECIIRYMELNKYNVTLSNIKTYNYGEDIAEGSSDMICTLMPDLDNRFRIRYSFEAIGESIARKFSYGSIYSSDTRGVKVIYTFRGKFQGVDSHIRSIVSVEAQIQAGRVDSAESEFDNITMSFSESYWDSRITLNGERIEY